MSPCSFSFISVEIHNGDWLKEWTVPVCSSVPGWGESVSGTMWPVCRALLTTPFRALPLGTPQVPTVGHLSWVPLSSFALDLLRCSFFQDVRAVPSILASESCFHFFAWNSLPVLLHLFSFLDILPLSFSQLCQQRGSSSFASVKI